MRNYQKFGDFYLDVETIDGIFIKYKEGFGSFDVNGLITKGTTNELEGVTLFLQSTAVVNLEGEEAEAIKEWWDYVHREVGDIS